MQIRKVHGINGVGINGAGTDKVGMVGASTVYVGTPLRGGSQGGNFGHWRGE